MRIPFQTPRFISVRDPISDEEVTLFLQSTSPDKDETGGPALKALYSQTWDGQTLSETRIVRPRPSTTTTYRRVDNSTPLAAIQIAQQATNSEVPGESPTREETARQVNDHEGPGKSGTKNKQKDKAPLQNGGPTKKRRQIDGDIDFKDFNGKVGDDWTAAPINLKKVGLLAKHEYTVESILDVRARRTGKEYLVKWSGWSSFNSWEPESYFRQAQPVTNFHNKRNSKIREIFGSGEVKYLYDMVGRMLIK